MSRRSHKIWLVSREGHEHSTPIRAFTLRVDAQRLADKMDREEPSVLERSVVRQIDLVHHNGAHILRANLAHAAGRNK